MINFVKRNASARGAGYIEQRMFYTREEHYKGRVNLEHRSGKILIITADKFTKLGNVVEEHQKIAADIQGLMQLGYDFYNNRDSTAVEVYKADSVKINLLKCIQQSTYQKYQQPYLHMQTTTHTRHSLF